MADGYARVTGTPGVVGLHTSVGTLNGASQIYNCYRDGSPVVVTAGHKDRTVLSEDGFCALPDLPEAVRPFTKWAHQTLSTAELGADLWRALHAAMTVPAGPAGPGRARGFPARNGARGRAGPAGGEQRAVVGLGRRPDGAQRGGVRRRGGRARRRPLARGGGGQRGARVRPGAAGAGRPAGGAAGLHRLHRPGGSAVPDRRSAVPRPVRRGPGRLQGCDLVLAIGARMFYPFSAVRHPRLPVGARLVHLHPDPAQVGRQLPTAVGLVGMPRCPCVPWRRTSTAPLTRP